MNGEQVRQNPFASPGESEGELGDPSPEKIRQQYLGTENVVRSFGLIWYVQAFYGGVIALIPPGLIAIGIAQGELPVGALFIGLIGALPIAAFAYFFRWLGGGLRELNPAVSPYASGLSLLGLLGFPVGTIIFGYYFWNAGGAKGEYVFSDEYKRIVTETPHIRWRTTIVGWLFFGFLGLSQFMLFAGLAVFFVVALTP